MATTGTVQQPTTTARRQFRRRAGEHPPRARPRTRPRRAARVRALRLARDDPLVARAVPSRSRRDTRGGSRDRSPSVSYYSRIRRFDLRAHLRGVGWPAPSRPRSPRAPHPRARVERADPAAASSGTFASRPRPTGLSHPSPGLAPRRDALPRRVAARVFAVCRRARLTRPARPPPPALHTQPSRVQTVHRRRERPSRPRGRPSRPTRTPPPPASRGRATGRRHHPY